MSLFEQRLTRPDAEYQADSTAENIQRRCALVNGIKRNQQDAIEEFYRDFCTRFPRFFMRNLGADHMEDAIHNVFMMAVDQIRKGSLTDPERLWGYVSTIGRRHVISQIKSNIFVRQKQGDPDLVAYVPDGGIPTDEQLIYQERIRLMRACLKQLNPREREVLERFYVREQTAEQIRQDMKLTVTQFRLLKSRAKTNLGNLGQKERRFSVLVAMMSRN